VRRPSKRLQAAWDRKLRASGFVDIERPNGRLRDDASLEYARSKSREQIEASIKYYAWARSCVWLVAWPSLAHERVWRAHADGWGRGRIALELGFGEGRIRRLLRESRRLCDLVPMVGPEEVLESKENREAHLLGASDFYVCPDGFSGEPEDDVADLEP